MRIIKNITRILIISIIFIILIKTKSYGAVTITKGSTVLTNRSISDFFDMSREMKDVGQGLEGTNVDVHMATNKEWATVSYFSNSNYGTATQGQNSGVDITIDGITYKSTNGNATGVMNWGKTATYTSGVISNYSSISDTSQQYTNGKSIIENAENEGLVDLVNTVKPSAMAKNGWYSSANELRDQTTYPFSVRVGLFGFGAGFGVIVEGNYACKGEPLASVTFRPVILN